METGRFPQFIRVESGADLTTQDATVLLLSKFSYYDILQGKNNAWTSLLNPVLLAPGISKHRKLAH